MRKHGDAVLDAHAHPLARNPLGADAAAGLVVPAVEVLAGQPVAAPVS